MKNPPSNPWAFPGGITATAHANADAYPTQEGMTLRDAFAIGIGPTLVQIHSDNKQPCDYRVVAESAYGYADAMLAEREKGAQ